MLKSFMTAFFMWLPVLIYKFFKAIGMLMSWILQVICGVPLYFCRPLYRIPGKILGTFGIFFSSFAILGMLIAIFDNDYVRNYSGGPWEFIFSTFLMAGIGFIFLLVSRFLVRRGSF